MSKYLDGKLQAPSTRQKRAFILLGFEKSLYEDIAQIEDVNIGMVRSKIRRTKKKLGRAFKGFDGETI